MDPHCFDADPDPDPAQNFAAGGGGGGRSAKNVHPPWQNPRYAPAVYKFAIRRKFKQKSPVFPARNQILLKKKYR